MKPSLTLSSNSSVSEMENDTCNESSFEYDNNANSLSSFLINTKKRIKVLIESSPKQISLTIMQMNHERFDVMPVLSSFLPLTNKKRIEVA